MKILHVGWGFYPICSGGYIEHVEDLMQAQIESGHEVFYFCSGRKYLWRRTPGLMRWRRHQLTLFEIINSPISDLPRRGVLNFEWEMNEPAIEGFFRKVLESVKPDIVHFQHLIGLPSSLIEISKDEYRLPTVMTLQDYFAICPNVKLFDASRKFCEGPGSGEKCIGCYPEIHQFKWHQKMGALLGSLHFLSSCEWLEEILCKIVCLPLFGVRQRNAKLLKNSDIPAPVAMGLKEVFRKRYELNVKRLERIDRLIVVSKSEEEICQKHFKNQARIVPIPLTVRHLESIQSRAMEEVPVPVRFATLNGCSSTAKGSLLILRTLEILHGRGVGAKFEMHIFGSLADEVIPKISFFNNAIYHGKYHVNELNKLLEPISVGIIPSIWEEIYGYVGLEFLAKGIPVIGNHVGGLPEYIIPDRTGWLNDSNSPEGLADIMARIIENPQQVLELNKKVISQRDVLIKKMPRLVQEIDTVYHSIH